VTGTRLATAIGAGLAAIALALPATAQADVTFGANLGSAKISTSASITSPSPYTIYMLGDVGGSNAGFVVPTTGTLTSVSIRHKGAASTLELYAAHQVSGSTFQFDSDLGPISLPAVSTSGNGQIDTTAFHAAITVNEQLVTVRTDNNGGSLFMVNDMISSPVQVNGAFVSPAPNHQPAIGEQISTWASASPTGPLISATEAPQGTSQHTLTVTRVGSGTVTSTPAGISCGSACSHSYTGGTAVALTATPAAGYTFAGWSGACGGTGACNVTMNSDLSVTATFKPTNPTISGTTLDHKHGSAKFTFSDPGASGFECALVKKKKTPHFKHCTSPKAYAGLKAGKYTFEVEGLFSTGPGPVSKHHFKI
jgi:uncharacterized repeat protein (TIGR02543 family)